jgi:hypothetical protein
MEVEPARFFIGMFGTADWKDVALLDRLRADPGKGVRGPTPEVGRRVDSTPYAEVDPQSVHRSSDAKLLADVQGQRNVE